MPEDNSCQLSRPYIKRKPIDDSTALKSNQPFQCHIVFTALLSTHISVTVSTCKNRMIYIYYDDSEV